MTITLTEDITLIKVELAALLRSFTPDDHEELNKMLAAHAIAAQRSLAFGKIERLHVGFAIIEASRDNPDASVDTLGEDALLILGVTP